MKKFLFAILGLLVLAAPTVVKAQFQSFINADGGVTITNYSGPPGTVTVPATINGIAVTVFGDGTNSVFRTNSGTVTNVTLPSGLTTISDWAFEDCYYMSNAPIPATVTTIGDGAFYYCESLEAITIPEGVADIGYETFYECTNFKSLTFPSSVTTINPYAFEYCYSLTNLTIPSTVTYIGEEAFYECGMTNLTIGDNQNNAAGGCTIEEEAFEYCYYVSNLFIGTSVVNIGEEAFYECEYLGTLSIGTNLASTNDTLRNGPCAIGYEAFEYCYALSNAVIGNSVASIGYDAFYESFYYASNNPVLVIGSDVTPAFGGCYIGYEAFEECEGLKTLTIHKNVTDIDYYGFEYCENLTTANINNTGGIGDYAFEECYAMSNVVIGPNVTSIGYEAFDESFYYASNSPTLIIGANGTPPGGGCSIGEYAFEDCYGLKSLTIYKSVTSIAEEAFYYCTNLATANINNSGLIGYEAFEYEYALNNLVIGPNVTGIGYEAFYYCTNGMTAMINMTGPIAEYAFEDCYGMSNVTIGPHVTSIGYEAFYDAFYYPSNCTVTIGGGAIQDYAFEECEGLQNVNFGPNVNSIGYEAFEDCYVLANLFIPDNISSIGSYAFDYCTNLHNVTIGKGVSGIPYYAFEDCYALTNITFGANVTSLDYYSFYDCTNLLSLYFKGNAPNVDNTAFYDDTNIHAAYYYAGTTGWSNTLDGIPTIEIGGNTVKVTLGSSSAIAAGGYWQLNNGVSANTVFTTLRDLPPGSYTISFAPISGYTTPASQSATITSNGGSFSFLGLYAPTTTPSNGLILLIDGNGTVSEKSLPKTLTAGSKYTLKAVPAAGNIFVSWAGGASQPYTILSTNPSYTFTMASGLVLAATFAPNPFNPGVYNGLFSGASGVTEGTAGMLKGLTIDKTGSYSGTLLINGGSHAIKGKFDISGQATNIIARPASQGGPLRLEMTLSSSSQVTGTVYGTNNSLAWTASLIGDLATALEPSVQLTLLMPPDANNNPPTLSPGGDGYLLISNYSGTAKNPASAIVKIAGALADGTSVSQSVPASEDGFIPVYSSLYANKGLLLGWVNLETANAAGVGLTWIKPAAKGLYPIGFTNLIGPSQIELSTWTNPPGAGMTGLSVVSTLATIGATNGTSNAIATSATGVITGTEVTGKIDPKTGAFKVTVGSGASKVTGYGAVLLDTTNGGGYFLTKTNAQGVTLLP